MQKPRAGAATEGKLARRPREKLPYGIQPMLATLTSLPAQPERYAFEYKWDGVRVLAFWDGRGLVLQSRNGLDVTNQYPELQALGRRLGRRRAVLDGEVVALTARGRVSFMRLSHRLHLGSEAKVAERAATTPVDYMIFDLLHLDGRSTRDLAYTERRKLLEGLGLETQRTKVPPYHPGEGAAMLETAKAHHLEGVVAKLLDSRYEAGARSRSWLKIKLVHRQELVIGGWQELVGDRDSVGAVLVGYYEGEGRRKALRFAGKVGTGFTLALRRELARELEKRAQEKSPFADAEPRGAHFVRPELVAEVEHRGWTPPRRLRQPSFKGLRTDKDPGEVVREDVVVGEGESEVER